MNKSRHILWELQFLSLLSFNQYAGTASHMPLLPLSSLAHPRFLHRVHGLGRTPSADTDCR